MATWLTHLRVSERLIGKVEISDNSLFFAGCIAPDTDISPDVSHWCTNGDKTTCDVDGFYKRYISNCSTSSDFDFFLGYYVHLLTDVMWHKQKIKPLSNCDNTTIKKVKESWRSVDYNFLSIQKEFYPIVAMRDTAKYKKLWFDYYSMNQIKDLVEYVISSCKDNHNKNLYIDMNAKNEIEQFIEEASIHIYQILKEVKLELLSITNGSRY